MCVSVCPCVCVRLDVWGPGGLEGGREGGTRRRRLKTRMSRDEKRRMRDG